MLANILEIGYIACKLTDKCDNTRKTSPILPPSQPASTAQNANCSRGTIPYHTIPYSTILDRTALECSGLECSTVRLAGWLTNKKIECRAKMLWMLQQKVATTRATLAPEEIPYPPATLHLPLEWPPGRP